GRGVSSTQGVRAILKEAMHRAVGSSRNGAAHAPSDASPKDIRLMMVTAALKGEPKDDGVESATTFEHVEAFAGSELETKSERVIDAALASACFPVVFEPQHLKNLGLCVDGGAVNNAPISYALDNEDVGRVIVVTPDPAKDTDKKSFRWFGLGGQLGEI